MILNQCVVTVTRNCNLRCSFCYAKETGYTEREELEFDDVKKIVDFCNDSKVNYIVLTGGEPTQYPYIEETIKYIKRKNSDIQVAISTNGTIFSNKNFGKRMKTAGLDYVDLSLKGCNEIQCEKTTGVKCFSKQMEAIRNIAEIYEWFTCSIVLTKDNINSFCDLVQTAHDNGGRQFSFTFALDNEKSNITGVEYLMHNNPFDLIESFMRQVNRLDSITDGEWWVEYTFPMCIYTEQQLERLDGHLAESCQIFKKNSVTIDAKLNLLPCSMHIQNTLGKFGSDFTSYDEFLLHSMKPRYKNVIDMLNELPANDCNTCQHLEACHGGCPIFWKNCSYDDLKQFKRIISNDVVSGTIKLADGH